ncbi:MAG: segregation/condensation protein A [Candidatus Pacearchaeota archaeon]
MTIKANNEKIGQEQFHSFVFSEEISWQEIIYDLINSEQLDPWDIDLSLLTKKYLEKINELEEANFSLSSKVLLVASLLLRIKSELLLNKYIKSLDEILFKKEEEIYQKISFEDFNEDIPELLPRSPLPRFKKVSLKELILALSKAINTEQRRITRKKEEKELYEKTKFFMPKKSVNLNEKIRIIYEKIKSLFEKHEKIRFSEFSGPKKQDKIDNFIPLLHLDSQNKLWLHQEKHLEEIWIHKSGEGFIKKDEIITDNIEREFEEMLESHMYENIDKED